MHQIVAEAIRRAAPYAGQFAHMAVSRLASFIAVAAVQNLRSRGARLPAGAEQLAAAAAAFGAARGMNPVKAAAQGIYDKTGIALSVSWNGNAEQPIYIEPYTPQAPAPAFEPPIGPQTTLHERLAAGTVSSDAVMPTFPPMYKK
jgi:hypothetical protein